MKFKTGFPSTKFKAVSCLRYGDPMSSYLFALSMEYLSRSLKSLHGLKEFGFHPKCKRVGLVFTYDILVFYKGNLSSMRAVKEKSLLHFSTVSRLKTNMDKSDVYFLLGLMRKLRRSYVVSHV